MKRFVTTILIGSVVYLLPWLALVADSGAAENTKKGAGGVKDITFDDIKFEMKKGDPFKRTMLTDKIEKLNGTTVRIRGYMLPSFQEKGITQFVLVRDNMECCFGPGAALYDCVLVEMNAGKSASYSIKPIAVQGKFEVSEYFGPEDENGKKTTLAIYRIAGEEVK